MKRNERKKNMRLRTIKLGTLCVDRATQCEGMITHWQINTDQAIDYIFQPHGLNPEDGQPIKKVIVDRERLTVSESDFEYVDIPFDILGSRVTDKASGFTGMAVGFTRHINGCFHVIIQPSGRVAKTNAVVQRADFDLRICEGEKIPKLTPEEKRESERKSPSPINDVPQRECMI